MCDNRDPGVQGRLEHLHKVVQTLRLCVDGPPIRADVVKGDGGEIGERRKGRVLPQNLNGPPGGFVGIAEQLGKFGDPRSQSAGRPAH